MSPSDEQIRVAIAEQASEWFIENRGGPLDRKESARFMAWLQASPVHLEEYLRIASFAPDLEAAAKTNKTPRETLLARARAADDSAVQALRPRASAPVRGLSSRGWLTAAVTLVGLAVVSLGLFSLWNVRPAAPVSARVSTAALHFATGHGEQLSRRLADGSVLHLDTDSAVSVRFGNAERRVTLTAGQADFEVAHDPARVFRVLAGAAEVVAVGTNFDVRLEHGLTVVTVIEGRVAVGTNANQTNAPRFVQLSADQQVRVIEGQWPATPSAIEAQRATAWLHREIVFDHEPLERVAAEFNRYAPKPIEIVTPALRNLQISGAFATDDTEAFIAFLRTLKGVRVEVTATQIRVSQQ
jgi:transmembrane sensor